MLLSVPEVVLYYRTKASIIYWQNYEECYPIVVKWSINVKDCHSEAWRLHLGIPVQQQINHVALDDFETVGITGTK